VKQLFALILCTLITTHSSAAQSYTQADLEALEKEQSYSEFFAHAMDVRPTERTEYWQTMVQNMGEGLLKSLLKKNRLEQEDFKQMERLHGWKVLANNEFFRIKRQEVATRWFTQCFQENSTPESPCWKDFVAFWEVDRQEPDMAPRLLTLLTPYMGENGDAANPLHRARLTVNPYFILKPLLISPLAELQCKKPELQDILWQKLKREWNLNLKQKSFTAFLNELAHESCWQALHERTHQLWKNGAPAEELTLSYLFLKSQGALTDNQRDLFYLSFLLTSPARGETFNLAWARLQELGKKPSLRDALLKTLKAWSPLPGELFNDFDLIKRRAVTRHLQRHFPEYLDHYAHVCVDFFGGKKRFPEGNPALYCRQLFTLAEGEKDLLPTAVIETFKTSL
jgi:hypothetical protein